MHLNVLILLDIYKCGTIEKYTRLNFFGGYNMIYKSTIVTMICLALICTSLYAEEVRKGNWKDTWRNNPNASKNSNEWRTKPYVGKTSDSWRNSPLSAKQSQSKLRWDKGGYEKSLMNWRNNPSVIKPIDSGSWQNRWDKKIWRDNPLNSRNSDLEWKKSRKNLERGVTTRKIKEWGSPKVQELSSDAEKTVQEPEDEKDLKPHMEVISVDYNSSNASKTKVGKYSTGQDNFIMVYGTLGVKVIKPGKPITKKFADGSIVLY
jgi:hypothetical protein